MTDIKKITIKAISGPNEASLKNYINKEISFSKLTILTGLNGCGKTHFLNYLNRELGYKQNQINYIPYDWKAHITDINKKTKLPIAKIDFERDYDIDYSRVNSEFLAYKRESQTQPQNISLERYPALKQLKEFYSDEEWGKIINEEYIYLPPDFTSRLNDWDSFIAFYSKWERGRNNNIIKVLKTDKDKAQDILNQKTPIDVINELFENYNFEYRMQINTKLSPIKIYFESIKDNSIKNIELSSLSSGEKMIVSLMMWSHNKNTSKIVKCLLLDEPDAHLHPSLSKMFMEIIYEKFVKEYKIQVVIATHSPSTIAYVPEEEDVSILFMDKDKKNIETIDKHNAIQQLSSGLMVLNQDAIELGLEEGVKSTNKPILCVEGITDKIIIKNAWEKLNSGKEIPFYIQDMFDCYFITNIFKRETIFCNYSDKLFIGLLDFDDALKNWKEKMNDNKYEYNTENRFWKHKQYKGYILPLPIPKSRADEAGDTIRDSYLSIEKYFDDTIIQKFCEEITIAKGGKILKFLDEKKSNFAKSTIHFTEENFENFKLLFNSIDSILKNKN